jgi:hypothetical protein
MELAVYLGMVDQAACGSPLSPNLPFPAEVSNQHLPFEKIIPNIHIEN